MFPLFLVYGYWLRVLYAIPLYFNFSSWVWQSPQSEWLYVPVATVVCTMTAVGVPAIGALFGLASAYTVWGWFGVLAVWPLVAVELYRWYLWNRADEAVTNGHLH
jgi:hypothetical protein